MLNDQQILSDIHSLPPEKQLKVLKYILQLKQDEASPISKPITKPLRPFGVISGKSRMAADFDAPLDDFRDYMP